MTRRGFASPEIIVIVLVAAVAIIGVWYFWTKPNPQTQIAAPNCLPPDCPWFLDFGDSISYMRQQGITMPIMIPAELPANLMNIPLKVEVSSETSSSYELYINANPADCYNLAGGGCSIGVIEAKKGGALPPSGQDVALADGIAAKYQNGALEWVENDILYTYGFGIDIKYPEDTITAMANSAVEAGGNWNCFTKQDPVTCTMMTSNTTSSLVR